MNNGMQFFSFNTTNEIRTVVDMNGEPWFVASDVCAALDIANVGNALGRLDKADIRSTDVWSAANNRAYATKTVNESGLYDLVLDSRKPEARAFRRWITREVLPNIRRDGFHIDDDRVVADPAKVAKLTARTKSIEARRDFTDVLEQAFREGIPTSQPFERWAATFTREMTKKVLGISASEFKARKDETGNFRDSCSPSELEAIEAAERVVVTRFNRHGADGIKALYHDAIAAMDVFA